MLELHEPAGDGVARLIGRAALSAREAQVTDLALQGFSNQGMAHRLGLSPATVAVYRRRAYRKAGVRSRLELLGLAQHLAAGTAS